MSAVTASPAAKGSGLDSVRALQHALYRTAKADPGRRFHALGDKVYRRDVLERAWAMVRRNGGAPGIDRTTLADVEQYGVSRLLDELGADLADGRHQVDVRIAAFEPVFDLRRRKVVQPDLHHRELVEVGVEQ